MGTAVWAGGGGDVKPEGKGSVECRKTARVFFVSPRKDVLSRKKKV